MKQRPVFVTQRMRLALGFLLILLGTVGSAQAKYLDPAVEMYADDRFIVKVWPEVGDLAPTINGNLTTVNDEQLSELNRKWNVVKVERLFAGPESKQKEIQELDLPGYWRFWVSKPLDRKELEAALTDFAAATVVDHVEPVGIHRVNYTPNDPDWSDQWYLNVTTGRHDIHAPEAWNIQRGDPSAILGITDTGVLYTHPDLTGNIWRNLIERNGTSGFDDDGNGFVDDSVGWDFVTAGSSCWSGEDCTTADNNPTDYNGHGTHCSGIAAAVTNNSVGVSGIAGGGGTASGARIMPLRIGWSASYWGLEVGYVGMDYAAQAFNYARNKGVCALNCSWGNSDDGGLGVATNAAITAGIVICVAAGNDDDQVASYLASRTDCIAIAATDEDDIKASFSSYGSWVDVSAPGVDIYATYSSHGTATYAYLNGTSMATPCVTGEAGLLKSQNSTWTRTQIIPAITTNVDDIDALNPSYSGLLGSGRINLYTALSSASTPSVTVTSPNAAITWLIGDAHDITWISTNFTENVDIHINRSYSGGTWEQIVSNTANDGSYNWTVAGATTTAARIRVQGHTTTTVNDVSDVNFSIAQRAITVTSPNTAVTWYAGESNNITWTSANLNGTVSIHINRSYSGGTWEQIVAGTMNDGSYSWTVSAPATSAARIRVTSESYPTVSDISDVNFTVAERTITITNPNIAVTWVVGESKTITWTSANITGNVNIDINRSYSGGTWESIVASTANDGSHVWTVTSPLTSAARIRVTSVTYSTISDVSDADFTIANRSITVTSPNTAVSWYSDDSNNITWTSTNVTGTVNIDVNRSYSGGAWESIVAGTANDGTHAWTVTLPATSAARIRVTCVSYPTVSDISDADFTIIDSNDPPAIFHNPLHDIETGSGTITALCTDPEELPISSVKIFYRVTETLLFDSLVFDATGNPNEFAADLSVLPAETYDYYLRVRDAGGAVVYAPEAAPSEYYSFDVGEFCGSVLAYDDGSAESFNYATEDLTEEMLWAVKFTPEQFPFVLCGASFAAARTLPDTVHTPVQVTVMLANGVDGYPGDILWQGTTGSIGNVIGGFEETTYFADVLIRDANEVLQLSTAFYIAVNNIDASKSEAFGRDTDGTNQHVSYFYDACEEMWFSEDDAGSENAYPGNRMIRAYGYSLIPPELVISRAAESIRLDWSNTGAASYEVFSSLDSAGPFTVSEGTTSDTTFVDLDAVTDSEMKFYQVLSISH